MLNKILQLTHRLPFPPNDGGRIGIFNFTKHYFLLGFKVDLLCIARLDEINVSVERLKEITNLLDVFYRDVNNKPISLLINTFFSTYPYTMQKYFFEDVWKKIKELLEKEVYLFVHLDHLHMAYYGRMIKENFPHVNVFIREHNVEYTILQRLAVSESNWIKKIMFNLQANRLKEYEEKMLPLFEGVLAITNEDAVRISQVVSSNKVCVIPAGVDLEQFPLLSIDMNTTVKRIVSLSSMDWIPNQQGIIWFIEQVLPVILVQQPDVVFVVAGRGTPDWMRKYQSKNVEIYGFIEDANKFLSACHVAVVPLFSGGGMRVKILNYLAWGIPTVSTTIGAEGLGFSEKSIAIADDPKQFAEHVLMLLKSKPRWEEQRLTAHSEVKNQYAWSSVVHKALEFCSKVSK